MVSAKPFVEIFTDGSCLGNPGPGGWSAILRCGEHEKIICGYSKDATNNKMELSAVVEGLLALKKPCKVRITTDSQYVVNSINKGWLNNWKQNGSLATRPNSNQWKAIIELLNIHEVEFVWVRGHNGHKENEQCDSIAVQMSNLACKSDATLGNDVKGILYDNKFKVFTGDETI
jgi:ribonuclease HI